jgi:hypothetical protein
MVIATHNIVSATGDRALEEAVIGRVVGDDIERLNWVYKHHELAPLGDQVVELLVTSPMM